jgi:hypothetical protein
MRLGEVALTMLQRTKRRVEGRCFECDAVLHVDLGAVIAAHGKTATLDKVGYTILCPVCEAAGLFLRESSDLFQRPLKSSVPHPTMVAGGRPNANRPASGR